MFAPHCPRCETRVLLGTRRVVGAEVTPGGGRAVVLRCWCGELVVDPLSDPAVPEAARRPDADDPGPDGAASSTSWEAPGADPVLVGAG